ncbi:MAG: polysaccharide deacetylase family protein [Candidatus Paceibacterota bacterium]
MSHNWQPAKLSRAVRTREIIPEILSTFDAYGIHATWATVGALFADTKEEILSRAPQVESYISRIGNDERDDPAHFASTLIRRIRETPFQEVGSHTFSHHVLGPSTESKVFEHEIHASVDIARVHGVTVKSIVCPQNKTISALNRAALRRCGITNYRGADELYGNNTPATRAKRFLDSYMRIQKYGTKRWDQVLERDGMVNVEGSIILRPFTPALRHLDSLKLRRITTYMEHAAKSGEIFHLWWHPHNFATYTKENFRLLRSILDTFTQLEHLYGMRSLTMAEVADEARL